MTQQQTLDAEQRTNGHSPNRPPTIRELEAGQRVASVFCVRERDLRQKRNGEAFLRLVLGDKSGSIEAVAWEEAESRYGVAEPGAALHVTGTFEQSDKWGSKIKVLELRPARDEEYTADDLAAGPELPVDRLEADLRELIATIQRPHGLLEHTVSVAQAVSAAAALFPGIDRDIAVTGALLHDIGKTEAYNDDPLAIELTDLGRLHG